MNPALAALAVATLAGAVLAVSARDVRSVVLGLLVVLAASPLIADPWPGPLPALVRVAAALLAVRLILVGARGLGSTVGSPIGWPAAALLAAAAAIAGAASHGLGAAPLGPMAAAATGFGLIALAVAPLTVARDVLRLAVGAVLLVSGALLVRVALDRPPSDGEQLVVGLLVIGLGGAVAVIATAAGAAGGLEAAPLGGSGHGRRPPEAHRMTAGDGAIPAPARPARPERRAGPTPPARLASPTTPAPDGAAAEPDAPARPRRATRSNPTGTRPRPRP